VRLVCCIDIETRSAHAITYGAWSYAHHPSTEVMCLSYGTIGADGAPRIQTWVPGDPLPSPLVGYIQAGGTLLAHNASFEQSIFEAILGPQFGWPVPNYVRQWIDTQELAAAVNLPASLEGVASALGCDIEKDKDGQKLMGKMSTRKPARGGGWTNPHDTPENRARLIQYCEADVAATLGCWLRLPPLSETEARYLEDDRRIGRRGVWLDAEYGRQLKLLALERAQQLTDLAVSTSDDVLTSSTSSPALKTWLESMGVELPQVVRTKVEPDGSKQYTKSASVARGSVAELLQSGLPTVRMLYGPEGVDKIHRVLRARYEAGKTTSLAKLDRVPEMTLGGGRLRFALRYSSAQTGRWASSGLQIHNLPKRKQDGLEATAIDYAVETADLGLLGLVTAEPLAALSGCLRSVIAAPEGRTLIAGDFSAVEARGLAWLAGEQTVLDRFRRGEDIYLGNADDLGLTGIDRRQKGKVFELGAGYQMGAIRLHEMAGGLFNLKESRKLIGRWRESRPAITRFWREIEDAARNAIDSRGIPMPVGASGLEAIYNGKCLMLVLPSGREIRYWRPSIEWVTRKIEVVNDDGDIEEIQVRRQEIRYYRPQGVRMRKDSTYAGKLTENVTQALCRDLLAHSVHLVERHPSYSVVMHVHDSVAAETTPARADVDEFQALLEHLPDWADGFPMAAEVYTGRRFRG
jgi:DNA polymerase bacteriophage-type